MYKKIAWVSILVTVVIILSKISGFIRDVALAYAFGTSLESDSFVLAISVVGVFSILFMSTTIAFMPVYKLLSQKQDRTELNDFISNTYCSIGIITIILSIVGWNFSKIVVNIMAPGFSGESFVLASDLTKILMFSIPFTFFSTIGCQQLRGEDYFIAPAAIAIPLNTIITISLLYTSNDLGIEPVAWAYVIGTFIQFIWIWLLIKKKTTYKFRFLINLKNNGLQHVIVLTFPILLGNAIQTINTVVDKILASDLEAGSMAALSFSNKLAVFIIGIISLGAGNVCYAKMSELGANNKIDELRSFLKVTINLLNFFVVPATVGLIVLSEPIVQTVFEYGAFDVSSREMTAIALVFYSIGLVGYSLREMISRAFYSLQDSATPMINGIISVFVNIVGNIILVKIMGIGGLALATSISAIFGTILLLFSFRKRLGHIGGKEMICTFFKCLLAAGIMGIAVRCFYNILYRVCIVPVALVFCICSGIFIYGLIVFFLKIPEVELVKTWLTNKIRIVKVN